ncbi:hypothetical protein B0T14DRAFT_22736 [Immersiella caudata]|uniref:Uncharacterized protein n=1 Tax=Immersiella caudata TaxID=314043 RepID=A0AA39XEC6_9PEZI|nr:hypothetical protein B0T14DRAFT_22736 [Immersiella caudata]
MSCHASRCGRVLQRKITSPRDSVWVSDDALSAAFEQYCVVSNKTQRRYAGNVPGPLECRRRLGRRHMGELASFQSPSLPPPWAFEVPLDFSQWQWEPPRRPDAPKPKQKHVRTQDNGWLGSLFFWSMPLEAEIPDQEPPSSHDLDHPASLAQPPNLGILFRTNVEDFERSAATSPLDVLEAGMKSLCHDLQQSISVGEHSFEIYCRIFFEILEVLDKRFGVYRPSEADILYMSLYSAFVAGASDKDLKDLRFWTKFIDLAYLLPIADFYRLSSTALEGFPKSDVTKYWSLKILCSRTPLKRAYDLVDGASSSLLKVQRILSSFGSAPNDSRAGVSLESTDAIQRARAELEKARFALTSADAAAFTYTRCSEIKRRAVAALWGVRDSELCSLFLTHWNSRGLHKDFDGTLKLTYEGYRSGRDDTALSALALAMFDHLAGSSDSTWLRRGLYINLWRVLKYLGRSNDMAKSLNALSHTHQLPCSFYFTLASACQDHHAVLRLASLYIHDLQKPRGRNWHPALVKRHVNGIISDGSVPSGVIWPALGIRVVGREVRIGRRRHNRYFQRHIPAIATAIATKLVDAPHLSPGAAFRIVSESVRVLEATTRRVPVRVIEALYRAVIKSTPAENMGVTARQQWFIDVVRRNYGDNVADKCCDALALWRQEMKRLHYQRTKAKYDNGTY